ncbi:MAG: hypothetical protein EHM17_11425 [Verrucomicrobiaceae bacterium]|nr:MAG: hypothetical protein EHM17_11425 [Verrucomicrobiaceae bacterium]
MKGIWQAATFLSLGMAAVMAGEAPKAFVWNPPEVAGGIFTQELGMLDAERDEYATNLADQAANHVAAAKASPASLADARHMLALALHLSPRNKRALMIGFQLSKGVLPDAVEGGYSAQAMARLLYSRGQLLEKQGGAENEKLSRMFIQLAATMDPRNEDAVYASEAHRLDHGELDWNAITDAGKKKP